MSPGLRWLFLVMLAVGYPTSAAAACWASNPQGTRICAEFQRRGLAFTEHLCEDHPGDCAKLGYEPARPAMDETGPEHRPAAAATVKPRSSPAKDAFANSSTDHESVAAPAGAQESPVADTFETFLRYGLGVALVLLVLGLMLEASGYPVSGAALTWMASGVAALWLFMVVFIVSMLFAAADAEAGRRRR